jgi:NACHT domain
VVPVRGLRFLAAVCLDDPALVGLPATWAASELARAARQWFRRLQRSDGLSRIIQAAAGGEVDLSGEEFDAIRDLLSAESTWTLTESQSLEDLAVLIGSCLAARSAPSALAAGRAIAGALLEFAFRDLEPEWFQQVLFARLERVRVDQASALDQAMTRLHADLTAQFACRDAVDTGRSEAMMGLLARALDRLPPSPADEGEVALYLATLARWLNTDPWPQDSRFGGPTLTPAEIERKLRVSAMSNDRALDLDADELGRVCARLVVLGGPGSGKTWLARRTARLCAEAALDALVAGVAPDEIELPLYTTCARLAATPPSDGIRRAVVSSALGHLPDLGGARVVDSLRVLLEERNAQTLLVVDSLDEARDADDRIRQVDTMPTAWRIVLTSRPGAWDRQLAIDDRDDDWSRRVGILQPLHYPSDVEPFIYRWFAKRPAWASQLTTQIRERRALQQAATIPLILAFYCIVGGDQPLPDRRSELYAKVIRRMLTGRWRGGAVRDPDPDACLEILRGWAWSAAAKAYVSGVGEWADEFSTPRVRRSRDDQEALDHVAVPLPQNSTDVDTGMTRRRFVHRSVRERLVAEHIALTMTVDEAARELLAHLWFDSDWEYVAPAALAMHPQRDQVLRNLMKHATGSNLLPSDLSEIDGCGEIGRFLFRVAEESGEDAWSPEAAQMIAHARSWRLMSPVDFTQIAASDWPTSDTLIQRRLSLQLRSVEYYGVARETAEAIARVAVSDHQRALARSALSRRMRESDPLIALNLAEVFAELNPSPRERVAARAVLLRLLAAEPEIPVALRLAKAVIRLASTHQEQALTREAILRMLVGEVAYEAARNLARTLFELNPSQEDKAHARAPLLGLITLEADPEKALELADAFAGLDPPPQDQTVVREALLRIIDHQTRPVLLYRGGTDYSKVQRLAEAVAQLSPSGEEMARARAALFALLRHGTDPEQARTLTETVARMSVSDKDRGEARDVLLTLLAQEKNSLAARRLARTAARLAVTGQELSQARQMLLTLLTRETDAWAAQELADAIAELDPHPEDRAQIREILLGLLSGRTDPEEAGLLIKEVSRLAETDEDLTQIRRTLLTSLTRETDPLITRELGEALARLAVTDRDLSQLREALLTLLTRETDAWAAQELADTITGLGPLPEEQASIRHLLLSLLANSPEPLTARQLSDALTNLNPTPGDRTQARKALLTLLSRQANPWSARELADTITKLCISEEERAQVRRSLLPLLANTSDPFMTQALSDAITKLNATVDDQAEIRGALLRCLAHAGATAAPRLAEAIARANPAPADQMRAREVLLDALRRASDHSTAQRLAETITRLDPSSFDRAQTRHELLSRLVREPELIAASQLERTIARLTTTDEDKAHTRHELLNLLGGKIESFQVEALARLAAQFATTDEDRTQTRRELLGHLRRETNAGTAGNLLKTLGKLSPTISDLADCGSWPYRPTQALLSAARHNSELSAWIAALPLFNKGKGTV